jgi:hypothetical protein
MVSPPIVIPPENVFFRAQVVVKNAPATWYLGARIHWGVFDGNEWAGINGLESSDIQINQPELFIVPAIIKNPSLQLHFPYWIDSVRFYLWLSLSLKESNAMSIFQPVKNFTATTGGNAVVATSVTSVALLTANADRMGFTIRNNSVATLYIALGATATADSALKIEPNAIYESPLDYVGPVSGIWSAADTDGYAAITEALK